MLGRLVHGPQMLSSAGVHPLLLYRPTAQGVQGVHRSVTGEMLLTGLSQHRVELAGPPSLQVVDVRRVVICFVVPWTVIKMGLAVPK